MPVIIAALVIGGAAAPILLWDKGVLVALASAPVAGSVLAGFAAAFRVALRSRRWRSTLTFPFGRQGRGDDARTDLR